MTVTRDAQVRYRGGPKSEILTQVSEGDTVVFLEDLDGWTRVSTADGYVGYMQSEDLTEGAGRPSAIPRRRDSCFREPPPVWRGRSTWAFIT